MVHARCGALGFWFTIALTATLVGCSFPYSSDPYPLRPTAQSISSLGDMLREAEVVILSGPQRSGTTFAARALGEMFNKTVVNEREIKVDDEERLRAHLDKKGVLVHCPGLSHSLQRLPRRKVAGSGVVVFMGRNCWDVYLSERKATHEVYDACTKTHSHVSWSRSPHGALKEEKKYRTEPALRHLYDHRMPICVTKQVAWLQVQREALEKAGWGAVALDYESLQRAPGYVNASRRVHFENHQTEVR